MFGLVAAIKTLLKTGHTVHEGKKIIPSIQSHDCNKWVKPNRKLIPQNYPKTFFFIINLVLNYL